MFLREGGRLPHSKPMIKALLRRILPIVLGGFFGFAGVLKATNPIAFAHGIMVFGIVPENVALGLAFYLPWLEIATALCLFLSSWRMAGLILVTGELLVFSIVLSFALFSDKTTNCGCLGSWGESSLSMALTRNLLLLFMSIWLFKNNSHGLDPGR